MAQKAGGGAKGANGASQPPPTNYIKRLLEEACPNHTYLIRKKLKDSGMMRSFMTSGSHTWVQISTKGQTGVIQCRSMRKMPS
jgi:hypothetical protein